MTVKSESLPDIKIFKSEAIDAIVKTLALQRLLLSGRQYLRKQITLKLKKVIWQKLLLNFYNEILEWKTKR